MRTSAVLIATVLLVSSAIMAPLAAGDRGALVSNDPGDPTADAAPLIITEKNTTNYLTLREDDIERTGTARTGLDASTAVAASADELGAELASESFERRYREAASQTQRTAILEQYVGRLERQERTVLRQNGAAMEAFANGTISARAFAQRRARIQAEGDSIASTARSIRMTVNWNGGDSPPQSLEDRLESVPYELEALQGILSNQFARGASDQTIQRTMYVESSAEGYTVATVNGQRYQRETYLGNARGSGETDQFKAGDTNQLDAATDRAQELYPWQASSRNAERIWGLGSTGTYRYESNSTSGGLILYLDGETTDVFREHQELRAGSIPTSETITETNGTLQATVNRTYESGPMAVSLARENTGVSAVGNVSIDGKQVGSIGPDGSTWIVEPRRPYTLNVTAESGGTVSITMR